MNLAQGIGAGDDPKLSQKPLLIQNMWPSHRGALTPRGGSRTISNNETANPNIFGHGGKLWFAGRYLVVSDGENEGDFVGNLHLFDVATEELNVDGQDIYNVEMAQNDTYRIIGYSYLNQVVLKAYERSTGLLLSTYKPPAGGTTNAVVRCLAASSNNRLCYYMNNGASPLKWGYFNETTKTFTAAASLTGSTNSDTFEVFAVDLGGGHVMTAQAIGNTTQLLAMNTADGATLGAYPVTVANAIPIGLARMVNPNDSTVVGVLIAKDAIGNVVTARGYDVNNGYILTVQTLWTGAGTRRAICGVGLQVTTTSMSIYWTYYEFGLPSDELGGYFRSETGFRTYTTTWAGGPPYATSVGTAYTTVYSASPIAPPFFAGPVATRHYVPLTANIFSSIDALDVAPLNNFLWDGTTTGAAGEKPLTGKWLEARAWPGTRGNTRSREVSSLTSEGGDILFATLYMKNPNSRSKGAKLVTLSPVTSIKPVLTSHGIRIPNSLPYYTDGQEIVEDNWPLIPPRPKVADSGVASGSMAAGTYYYKIMWKATDADGRTFRSAASQPSKVIQPGGKRIDVQVGSCPYTNRDFLEYEVYRTEANGGVWLFLTSGTVTAKAATLATTYQDTKVDADLGNPIYTTGGVLDDDPPSGHRVATLHHGRYCYAPRDRESTTVLYGKESGPTDPLAHSIFLQIPVDAEGGPITALQSYRGDLIIFKERRIYVARGVEKNNLGQGYGYRPAQLLSASVGTSNQKTIVVTDVGLMFLGSNGLIYTLRPNMKLDRTIGERVIYYTGVFGTVASATVWEAAGAAFFIMDTGTLVYFWEYDCWVLWTLTGVDICSAFPDGQEFIYFHTGALVAQWYPFLTQDYTSSYVVCAVDSGWQSPGGLCGDFVTTRVLFLGQKNSVNANVDLAFAFNHDTKWVDAEGLTWSGSYFDNFTLHYLMTGTTRDEACILDATPSDKGVTAIRAKLSFTMLNTELDLSAMIIGFLPGQALYRPGTKRQFQKL